MNTHYRYQSFPPTTANYAEPGTLWICPAQFGPHLLIYQQTSSDPFTPNWKCRGPIPEHLELEDLDEWTKTKFFA